MKKLMMAALIALSGSVASASCNMQSTAGLFTNTAVKQETRSGSEVTSKSNREGKPSRP